MKKITKQMIVDNYNEVMCFYFPNGRKCFEENKRAGYTTFNKKEGCRYYLWPMYTDITDYFTSEEMIHNFYLGDIIVLDFKKFPDSDPIKFFGDEWTKEYGILSRWSIDLNN